MRALYSCVYACMCLLQVIDSTLVKLFVWYDNEFGYTMRMVELAQQVAAAM